MCRIVLSCRSTTRSIKADRNEQTKQTKEMSTLYLNPFIPPSPTHTHGRIPTGNKCQSSFHPTSHSLPPEWNVCPSFTDGQFSPLLLPSPSRVPKGALISHHKDKSMSERERDGFGLAQT